jgi:hypothetical protein
MLGWSGVLAQQERYRELLREAERNHLAVHELALQERSSRWHRRAIAWLGRTLVAWGWRLQDRREAGLEMAGLPGTVACHPVSSDGCQQRGDSW